ncbi:MAG TPA: tRNA pseudouridine(38-40) synthase TruA [Flavobacteriales bacterium]|jgi:tRNA pseudouridine38-40 synthase|nr:tRNA pseudouridine(38-40) synthase TruA [Flavobacteriales bacterium]
MHRYFIKLAYKGTSFHGWQKQSNATSVQQAIEIQIQKILGRELGLTGCGRTDTGVHATEFYAHFEVDERVDTGLMQHKLNLMLPRSIAIYNIFEVDLEDHARFSATRRTYRYFIKTLKDPFSNGLYWHLRQDLSIDAMKEAAGFITGRHEFTSFKKMGTPTETDWCQVFASFWKPTLNGYMYEISADRFLRNMVRALVGTMVEIGKQRVPAKSINGLLIEKDRSKAGYSAPAEGLFLHKVEYPFIQKGIQE